LTTNTNTSSCGAEERERNVIRLIRWLAADPAERGPQPSWDAIHGHPLNDELSTAAMPYWCPHPSVPIPAEPEIARDLLDVIDPPPQEEPF
jgi:hypothetical protein